MNMYCTENKIFTYIITDIIECIWNGSRPKNISKTTEWVTIVEGDEISGNVLWYLRLMTSDLDHFFGDLALFGWNFIELANSVLNSSLSRIFPLCELINTLSSTVSVWCALSALLHFHSNKLHPYLIIYLRIHMLSYFFTYFLTYFLTWWSYLPTY